MTWTVYIVRCADESLYTGITKELDRRINEHNTDDKKGARYTRARRPVSLVYQENYQNRSQASQREWALKQLTRTEKLQIISGTQQ